jgi:CubicO group peptidase (beta-lactamase class C family)
MSPRRIAALFVLLVAALAGNARAEGAAHALPQGDPAKHGLSAARLQRMADFYGEQVAQQVGAGYVLMIARDGELVFARAIGQRDRERKLPMTLDTRFRIASMTKPVTSVAALMLYEEGRFALDDPVARFLPEFEQSRVLTGADAQGKLQTEPAKRPISIRDLLTHQGGLGYGPPFDADALLAPAYAKAEINAAPTLAEAVRRIAALPLYSHPGEQWRYSFSDDVLGRLVEVVSGMPFERFLATRIFTPLGMSATAFGVTPGEAPVATVYKRDAAGALSPTEWRTLAWPSGGGGLVSTAGDYLRFAQMLANGGSLDAQQILSPATVALMTSNLVPEDAQQKYWKRDSNGLGYGFGVGVLFDARQATHAGFVGDFSWGGYLDTQWLASPRSGLVAVLLCQVAPTPGAPPRRTYVELRNLLFATLTRLDATPAARAAR